jgi:hypothetical protein
LRRLIAMMIQRLQSVADELGWIPCCKVSLI